jgi:argininosuccinate synthase
MLNVEEEFYQKGIKYLIFGNVLKNHTYPLSVSAERVFQAVAIAEYAKEIGADAIAHGSTGAGNDQVRFDLVFQVMAPEMEIITPIRDQKLSREEEVVYLTNNGIEQEWAKAKYSINKGLWGTSVGGAETLTSHKGLPEEAWPTKVVNSDSLLVEIGFEEGEPITLNNERLTPVELIKKLQEIAQPYGIGRDIHVGDTIIGIKGRVGFEAAAPMIIIKAHQLLEKHTLGKWQLHWKDQLADWYGMLMHEGQYLDPVMRNIETFLEDTQETVSGKVFVKLETKRFELEGIESENDLMASKFGQYGEMNNAWSGEDVKGFTKILANSMLIQKQTQEND